MVQNSVLRYRRKRSPAEPRLRGYLQPWKFANSTGTGTYYLMLSAAEGPIWLNRSGEETGLSKPRTAVSANMQRSPLDQPWELYRGIAYLREPVQDALKKTKKCNLSAKRPICAIMAMKLELESDVRENIKRMNALGFVQSEMIRSKNRVKMNVDVYLESSGKQLMINYLWVYCIN